MIEQDARGLAGFLVAQNLSVFGIRRVFVDTGDLKRALIGPGRKCM